MSPHPSNGCAVVSASWRPCALAAPVATTLYVRVARSKAKRTTNPPYRSEKEEKRHRRAQMWHVSFGLQPPDSARNPARVPAQDMLCARDADPYTFFSALLGRSFEWR